jgi:UDP-2,4-diacetamido-2,4,6-trideoxy-beta-L-altropyranose hydrolase
MRIAVRADVSSAIGTGHVRRCLTLIEAFARAGHHCRFVARRLDVALERLLGPAPCEVSLLPSPDPTAPFVPDPRVPHAAWAGVDPVRDAEETAMALASESFDLLLVDHYSFSADWHDAVRRRLGCRVAVIDDVADRSLSADFVIDHNHCASHERKFAPWLTRPARILGGPAYAMLAPAYSRCLPFKIRPEVRRLGVFMGGADPNGHTRRVLAAVHVSGFAGEVNVVSTSASPDLAVLASDVESTPGARLMVDLPDLHGFYSSQDLVLGAGGGSTWERCAVGVPSLSCILASNQWSVLGPLEALGVTRIVDLRGPVDLVSELRMLLDSRELRAHLSRASQALVDGRGADRIAKTLCGP